MKKLLTLGLLLFATPALAQQAEPEFNLHLTTGEINLVAQGLQQTGPFNVVAALLNKLQQQLNVQSPPTNAAASPVQPPVTPLPK